MSERTEAPDPTADAAIAAPTGSPSGPADSLQIVTPEGLFKVLADLGLRTQTVEHPPLFTVEQSQALRGRIAGGHTKNLFLKDKLGALLLVVAREDLPIDLKTLHHRLGVGRLSFASAERLRAVLGVEPGSVTPFAIVNDRAGKVRLVLDAGLLAQEPLNFHPLVNTMTTSIARGDFLRFVRACGHEPDIRDLAGAGGQVTGEAPPENNAEQLHSRPG